MLAIVLATRNPTGFHFDPTKHFADQVDLQSPLLSRFDLIFTMRERFEETKILQVADAMVEGRHAAGWLQSGRELPNELRQLVEPSIDIVVYQAYISWAKELQAVAADQGVRDAMKNW